MEGQKNNVSPVLLFNSVYIACLQCILSYINNIIARPWVLVCQCQIRLYLDDGQGRHSLEDSRWQHTFPDKYCRQQGRDCRESHTPYETCEIQSGNTLWIPMNKIETEWSCKRWISWLAQCHAQVIVHIKHLLKDLRYLIYILNWIQLVLCKCGIRTSAKCIQFGLNYSS